MQNPFIPTFDQLPSSLPLFPLEGAVVMPGAQLPLNIFEPRYLNMLEDALAAHHLIGMIQPHALSAGDPSLGLATGCAGRISAYQETSDGRIEIVLTGVYRFDVKEELATTRGYRLVVPDWDRFEGDATYPDFDETSQQAPFFRTLDRYLQANQLDLDREMIRKLPFARLINLLTTLLPLHHREKQAIIEAVSFQQRYNLLISQLTLLGDGAPSRFKH